MSFNKIFRFILANTKSKLPSSAIFGGILLIVADTVARTAFSPIEVPVGVFMSLIGAPFFLYLLKRGMQKR